MQIIQFFATFQMVISNVDIFKRLSKSRMNFGFKKKVDKNTQLLNDKRKCIKILDKIIANLKKDEYSALYFGQSFEMNSFVNFAKKLKTEFILNFKAKTEDKHRKKQKTMKNEENPGFLTERPSDLFFFNLVRDEIDDFFLTEAEKKSFSILDISNLTDRLCFILGNSYCNTNLDLLASSQLFYDLLCGNIKNNDFPLAHLIAKCYLICHQDNIKTAKVRISHILAEYSKYLIKEQRKVIKDKKKYEELILKCFSLGLINKMTYIRGFNKYTNTTENCFDFENLIKSSFNFAPIEINKLEFVTVERYAILKYPSLIILSKEKQGDILQEWTKFDIVQFEGMDYRLCGVKIAKKGQEETLNIKKAFEDENQTYLSSRVLKVEHEESDHIGKCIEIEKGDHILALLYEKVD